MRETKFRAWDDIEKRWLTHAEVCNGLVFRDDGWVGFLVEHLHLMQYTGLKDKNGVEIYEGDVVRFHTDKPDHWMQEIDMAKGRIIKQIVWHEGKFHCKLLDNDSMGDVLNWHATTLTKYLEVIGNIYENPELLEQPNAK